MNACAFCDAVFVCDLCSYLSVKILQQRMAQEVLTTLKEHPQAWTRVDTILEYSQSQQTKYYALQILENVIKTRWKVLPRAQCEGSQHSLLNSFTVFCIYFYNIVQHVNYVHFYNLFYNARKLRSLGSYVIL